MKKTDLYETVRTVEHLCTDGSEALIVVKAFRAASSGEAIILAAEGDYGPVMIHSAEQADRLMRAIAAAAAKLDWPEIATIELAQEARQLRAVDRPPEVRSGTSRTEAEYSLAWVAENPALAASKWSLDLGVPLRAVRATPIDKALGLYDLTVHRDAPVAPCVIHHEDAPHAADEALRNYLGSPEGYSFDFERDGFVTIIRDLTPSA
jgi:hypothetical protein